MMIRTGHLTGQTLARGFTLLEAMLMITILSVVALGAGVGLHSLAKVPKKNDDQLVISNLMVDRMEQLRATAFASLAPGGPVNGISWTVTTADPKGGSTPQADFKQITVTCGGRTMSSYVTQP